MLLARVSEDGCASQVTADKVTCCPGQMSAYRPGSVKQRVKGLQPILGQDFALRASIYGAMSTLALGWLGCWAVANRAMLGVCCPFLGGYSPACVACSVLGEVDRMGPPESVHRLLCTPSTL